MSMNQTPSAERLHIGFFGRRNAGKSSLVNAIAAQDLALVSDVAGTTTDPVYKAMELLPFGPVVLIDTPGIDDEGALGDMRVDRSMKALERTNLMVVVLDSASTLGEYEQNLIDTAKAKGLPYVVVINKMDELDGENAPDFLPGPDSETLIYRVSAKTGMGIQELKDALAGLLTKLEAGQERTLLADLVKPGELAILVVPIDKSAPKGRLILPQQQTIRALLDIGANGLVCREDELEHMLDMLPEKPAVVITDSQVFQYVSSVVPNDVKLTSFSILFARYKGNLDQLIEGAEALAGLKDGDRVLISEGCTHHRQCEDIGTVKIPGWIREHSGASPEFDFTSGHGFPDDLSPYKLVVHCGGCMLNAREMGERLARCQQQGVPVCNYGIAIAEMKGILDRSIEILHK